jgi:hypothetical protein
MSKPHKHSDLIKLWADGAQIQVKACNVVWEDRENPYWATDREYRIKPEEKKPVVRWLWANINGSLSTTFASIDEVNERGCPEQWIRLDWSRQEFPE